MATNNAVNTNLSGQTGTGSFVGSTSPTLVTPTLGVSTATSIAFGGTALSTFLMGQPFTPTFTFATPGDLSVSYAVQIGVYHRINNLVFISYTIRFTPTYTTSSGVARFGGLPLTVSNNYRPNVTISEATTFPVGVTALAAGPVSGDTYITVSGYGTGTALTALTTASFPTATQKTVVISGFYETP